VSPPGAVSGGGSGGAVAMAVPPRAANAAITAVAAPTVRAPPVELVADTGCLVCIPPVSNTPHRPAGDPPQVRPAFHGPTPAVRRCVADVRSTPTVGRRVRCGRGPLRVPLPHL